MRIGVPKEIKNNENRVGMTPAGAEVLVNAGHEVFIEQNAGAGSGILDQEYIDAGASMLASADEVWAQEIVVKVKEPLEPEYQYFHRDLLIFTYLHLAAERELTMRLLASKCTAIAYETVQTGCSLPLLRPMSEVAGRRAAIVAATHLERHRGGRGILLSGVPGVERGHVVVIGGGIAGVSAAQMAIGLGARVTIIEMSENRMRELDDLFGREVTILKSNPINIARSVKTADVLIGAILIPGAKANKVVSEEMVASMPKGSVIVDIAIDQGGSIETIDRVTTHDDPVYIKHGVVHYSVANIPGATPHTSTYALTNATTPYLLKLADLGWKQACREDESLLKGLNVVDGQITCVAVAKAFDLDYIDARSMLS